MLSWDEWRQEKTIIYRQAQYRNSSLNHWRQFIFCHWPLVSDASNLCGGKIWTECAPAPSTALSCHPATATAHQPQPAQTRWKDKSSVVKLRRMSLIRGHFPTKSNWPKLLQNISTICAVHIAIWSLRKSLIKLSIISFYRATADCTGCTAAQSSH